MGVVECLIGLAATATTQGEPVQAAMLLGAADVLREEMAASLFAAEQAVYQHAVELAQTALGLPAWEVAHRAGQTMPLLDVVGATA